MAALFDTVCATVPSIQWLSTAYPSPPRSEVHTRIDAGGLGGKIVLTPWPPKPDNTAAALSADVPSPI